MTKKNTKVKELPVNAFTSSTIEPNLLVPQPGETTDIYEVREARARAIEYAINLFTHTQFREMLLGKDANGNPIVADVAFYQVALEFYEFLKTGNFNMYNQYVQAQNKK